MSSPIDLTLFGSTTAKSNTEGREEREQKRKIFQTFLESQIISIFGHRKLTLFRKIYHEGRNLMEYTLADNDLNLFMLWAHSNAITISSTQRSSPTTTQQAKNQPDVEQVPVAAVGAGHVLKSEDALTDSHDDSTQSPSILTSMNIPTEIRYGPHIIIKRMTTNIFESNEGDMHHGGLLTSATQIQTPEVSDSNPQIMITRKLENSDDDSYEPTKKKEKMDQSTDKRIIATEGGAQVIPADDPCRSTIDYDDEDTRNDTGEEDGTGNYDNLKTQYLLAKIDIIKIIHKIKVLEYEDVRMSMVYKHKKHELNLKMKTLQYETLLRKSQEPSAQPRFWI